MPNNRPFDVAELDEANPLMAEIMAESASAYFATIRKMEAALSALQEFDREFPTSPLSDDRRRVREDLVADAAEKVWFFIIQREAMKLTYYDELFADFGIAEEVRRRMGPKDPLFRS